MKKIFNQLIISILLMATFIEVGAVEAAESKTATIAIPTNTGLIGDDYATKSYVLELPSEVTAASINTSSIKYIGTNTLIGGITLVDGKVNLKLNGVANTKMLTNLKGYRGSWAAYYLANPSNSIWRYSDGRRWQINEYEEARNSMKTYDKPAEDNGTPSVRPPRVVVSAGPAQDMQYIKWYDGAQTNVIDSKYIVTNTITPIVNTEKSSSYIKEPPKFKNGRVIVNYAIPYMVSPNGEVAEQTFTNQDADSSHPLVGHAEGRKYEVNVYYSYRAEAKVPTYSYSGSVSFSYTPITEPTLDGRVAVMHPSPNPTLDEGKDIPVTLKITGDLLAYTDSSNIMEWVFYAKETDSSAVSTKKDGNRVLTSTKSFDNFMIPKAKFAGGDFEQEYTVTVTVRFSRPVVTPAGSVTSLTKTMKARVGVTKTPTDIPTQPSGGTKPPVAILDIPDSVMAGEEFMVDGQFSYDPDGRIVDYRYATPAAIETVAGKYGFTWYPLSEVGKWKSINLRVTDNDGLQAATNGKLEVTAPIPQAAITISGTRKENRKVTLHNASIDLSEHYPIVDAKTQFTIQAISGGTAADIKYSGTLAGLNDIDVLFKKAGIYKATIYVENNAGYSDAATIIFEIVPDEYPVVYFAAPSKVYRDPDNGNAAPVPLTDMSFSTDYDFVGRRLWEYRYDAENDGDFTNNAWTIFSNSNQSSLSVSLNRVGKYEIKLTVFEEFDQPTIDEFVTEADRRSSDSYTSKPMQPLAERVVEVYNRAPVVDWSW